MSRSTTSPKILVAPLDWGLGHATRCIPIIKELIEGNCTVLIAASGNIKILLQAEFPLLRFLPLPGYNIEYAASAWKLATKIAMQMPKILSAIRREHAWLKKVVEEEKIDAVISDNRYGLHHPKITSVFLTHQLMIKAGIKTIEQVLQKINYRYINSFDECWVPDEQGGNNLAGALSHPALLPGIPVHYIGAISRFHKGIAAEKNCLLLLLSGPEPQRSILEKKLLEDIKDFPLPVVLARGLPLAKEELVVDANVTVFNHLPASLLQEKIKQASFVISRCGYSTVMDLAILNKKSILIATPGQTEQGYLAQYLMKKNFALCIEQKKFRLKQALEFAQSFNYNFPTDIGTNLKPVIKSFLQRLNY